MKAASYPKYKDSGMSWLGEIPEHWDVKRLKRFAHLRSGESITAYEIYDNGEYPVYGGNGLRGFTKSYTHRGDYVLIGRQGALCGCINYANGCFWASEHAVVVATCGDVATKWLGELLCSMDLNQYSQSAAQPGLSVETIAALFLPVPPAVEQRAIADFLDRETARIDELIAKKQRQIELLQEKRAAVISHAVTKGLNPDAKMKDSGIEWLGKIPEHWVITQLKYLTKVQNGLTLGKKYDDIKLTTRPYLRVANVQDGYLALEDIAEIELPEVDTGKYELKQGDVLMTEGGDFDKLGRGYVWENQIPGCLHQNHIFAVRPNPKRLDSYFLGALISSMHGKHYFTSTSSQTTRDCQVFRV